MLDHSSESGHSIYIHFPYCLYKCHYCDFNSYAYDQDDTQINDLLAIDDGYWYYDTVDGSFYYDQTADQNMEDAVKIAEVTNDGNALTKDDLSSTDIFYNSDIV